MTQKEIDKFLANTKVYVNGKSKEIQEKLFSLGYHWPGDSTKVMHEGLPFLFIHKDRTISFECDMCNFARHPHHEISAEEILSIELTEPKYRPFKDIEECWNEMKKHEPFGYVKSKCDGSYNHYKLITKVSNSTTIGKDTDSVIEFETSHFVIIIW